MWCVETLVNGSTAISERQHDARPSIAVKVKIDLTRPATEPGVGSHQML
jgi:hypothetical protein